VLTRRASFAVFAAQDDSGVRVRWSLDQRASGPSHDCCAHDAEGGEEQDQHPVREGRDGDDAVDRCAWLRIGQRRSGRVREVQQERAISASGRSVEAGNCLRQESRRGCNEANVLATAS
jgi:hypothetical protein